jgi:hypothetical protein
MTDMYLKMNASELIIHYSYLTQAMIRHTLDIETTKRQEHWMHQFRKAKKEAEKKEEAPAKKKRGKLNAAKALKIYKSRLSHVELARRYGVHYVTISDVKHGRSWTHVTGHGSK